MFSPNHRIDEVVRKYIIKELKRLASLDDTRYEIEYKRLFKIPQLTGYVSRIQTIINHINNQSVKVDVLSNMFSHLDKLNQLGG